MKIIHVIAIILTAAVLIGGTVSVFMSQTEEFANATAADGYAWIAEVAGGGPTLLVLGLIAIVIGVIIFAFRR